MCLTLGAGSAFAEDVWAYTYPDGTQAYIDTDSIYQVAGGEIDVKVKKVRGNQLVSVEKFLFNHDEGAWWFGYRFGNGPIQRGGNVAYSDSAWNILNVVRQYL